MAVLAASSPNALLLAHISVILSATFINRGRLVTRSLQGNVLLFQDLTSILGSTGRHLNRENAKVYSFSEHCFLLLGIPRRLRGKLSDIKYAPSLVCRMSDKRNYKGIYEESNKHCCGKCKACFLILFLSLTCLRRAWLTQMGSLLRFMSPL